MVFDGSNKSDVGFLLLNINHTIVNDSKFVNVIIGIDGQFNGDVSLTDYAGGPRVERSSFLESEFWWWCGFT